MTESVYIPGFANHHATEAVAGARGVDAELGWRGTVAGRPLSTRLLVGYLGNTSSASPAPRPTSPSSVTLAPLPLRAIYTASKAAANALGDSMAIELEPFGVRVRTVLPGRAPETSFSANARTRMSGGIPDAYTEIAERAFAGWQQDKAPLTPADDVAEAIWIAVTSPNAPTHIPAGADAVPLSRAE